MHRSNVLQFVQPADNDLLRYGSWGEDEMGARFDLEHVNFVAYLTADQKAKAPRTEVRLLSEFLDSVADSDRIKSTTISTSKTWQRNLQRVASRQRQQILTGAEGVVSEENVARVLDPLRAFFTGYQLYVLLIPGAGHFGPSSELLSRSYVEFVRRSSVDILVLFPYSGPDFISVIDPFPALQSLANQPIQLPGAVFWTKQQNAVALPIADARKLFEDNIASRDASPTNLDRAICKEAVRRTTKKIMHISDLHFGNALANSRRNYLKQHLANVAKGVDRIVISGDLFDSPKRALRDSFEEFRSDLRDMTAKDPIVVVGNHDVRLKGNALAGIGRNSEFVTDIGFDPIIVDDDLRVVFLCFNSCDGGNLARGRVTPEQRRNVAAQLEQLYRKDSAATNYLKIAVVHHHPYRYGTLPTALYERFLTRLFPDPDSPTAFENARDFVNWCATRGVSLILHGHKHVPHVVKANLQVRQVAREITIVGCGSTTGVEHKPMCYDLIGLDPVTGRFSVSFYHDPDGDGSGFSLQSLSIDLRTSLP